MSGFALGLVGRMQRYLAENEELDATIRALEEKKVRHV